VRANVLLAWFLAAAPLSGGCRESSASAGAESTTSPSGPPGDASPQHSTESLNAYFGDLHVHTQLSYDAFLFGTRAGPDDAYRFAEGGSIQHPAGRSMQLDRPLDFLAVTDHAKYLGMLRAMHDPDSMAGNHPAAQMVREANSTERRAEAFRTIRPYTEGKDHEAVLNLEVVRSAWQEIIEAAERHNDPGSFTTLIGYEFTTYGPSGGNLHRNVIFRSANVPELPFSRIDSQNPEDLWDWMDRQRDLGREALAIPHNSNGSNGEMFQRTDWAGNPMDEDYAQQRMRNEPLVEVTQVKGTSETHPMLSPNDEWAAFEIFPNRIASELESQPPGSYVRDAYRRGLEMSIASGANPYRFGLIGASDTHVSAGSFEESDYWSKVGLLDATPVLRGSVPSDVDGEQYQDTYYSLWGASGLTGVWAEDNTREAIFDALRRKETFATSGPRIRLRVFGGFQLDSVPTGVADPMAGAKLKGTPMGGTLDRDEVVSSPGLFVWALRDPEGAPLQRIQVIKGWVSADGRSHERVYDAVCSDGLKVDPNSRRCPDNGALVRLTDCSISSDVGADELSTLWVDPDFHPAQEAFYYVRVLQNPTCRWSTWDAVRAGVQPRENLAPTIQERAWSSPVWYRP